MASRQCVPAYSYRAKGVKVRIFSWFPCLVFCSAPASTDKCNSLAFFGCLVFLSLSAPMRKEGFTQQNISSAKVYKEVDIQAGYIRVTRFDCAFVSSYFISKTVIHSF